jgi:hypothetical protein
VAEVRQVEQRFGFEHRFGFESRHDHRLGRLERRHHELKEFKRLVAEYDAKHPEVKVKVVGDIVDDKITAAIRAAAFPMW